jgi:hypothetical protein
MQPGKIVVLADRVTGLFWRGPAEWCRKSEDAFNFGALIKAYDFAERNKLRHMDVLIAFDDHRMDARLSVTP